MRGNMPPNSPLIRNFLVLFLLGVWIPFPPVGFNFSQWNFRMRMPVQPYPWIHRPGVGGAGGGCPGGERLALARTPRTQASCTPWGGCTLTLEAPGGGTIPVHLLTATISTISCHLGTPAFPSRPGPWTPVINISKHRPTLGT